MTHPYTALPDRAFWSRAFAERAPRDLVDPRTGPLVPDGAAIVSVGSCFAANLVPFLERAGLCYLRTEPLADWLRIAPEALGYGRYSAAYGNVYTARQLLQLLRRACGTFAPAEDRWPEADRVVDPYRPGLRYAARTDTEFTALTTQHLRLTRDAFAQAGVVIVTLGLTEAWTGLDGAVFPACPGTVAGRFDPERHRFVDFSCAEVTADLAAFVTELRALNPGARVILTVSPVPLVATAGGRHVLEATAHAKAVLRVAAGEVARALPEVIYFPAYEIVTGPQAPDSYFAPDRRSVGPEGIRAVMRTFLAACGRDLAEDIDAPPPEPMPAAARLSHAIAQAECEEEMTGRPAAEPPSPALRPLHEMNAKMPDTMPHDAPDPDTAARIAALAAEHGPLPADFDGTTYIGLHPDLAALFTKAWQGELHYLEHGRREGRLYPSNVTRAETKVAQARRIALVLDGLDGAGKSTIARLVAEAIGGCVLHPYDGNGPLLVWLARTGQHALADSIAHAAVAMAMDRVPEGVPIVFDRHWFTASQLLSSLYRPGWEPRPFTLLCWADRETTVARMIARGEDRDALEMTQDRVDTYRRLAAELDVPLLDTSRTTPEEAAAHVLALLTERGILPWRGAA
ncbi:hypothetical protein PMNALOAF_1899 [Methylobacterium adhaesivum]|uniref:GSCFA domain-containing protein n=1 Tax=Methylobacterium adhaesivum TaxID=333297 RepID=A0ABT8BC64_9HYPH|nr:GSCFA domain-containing protein [Methylobacterium adhaesivum]MDN3589632.1 GSCFA domain-containing protein [Methylobacterium adhaesivum]GJD30649.1 hypothetical protein PMNALOAF_1899 [Methylobacterium adhaesivum]